MESKMFKSIQTIEIVFSKNQQRKVRKAEAKQVETKAGSEPAAVKPLCRNVLST